MFVGYPHGGVHFTILFRCANSGGNFLMGLCHKTNTVRLCSCPIDSDSWIRLFLPKPNTCQIAKLSDRFGQLGEVISP